MNLQQANEQIVRFFGGQKLTFCIERFGSNHEEWVARCDQAPAISTSGYGFDEREIRDQVRDAVVTAAGVDGKYTDKVFKEFTQEFTLTNELVASV